LTYKFDGIEVIYYNFQWCELLVFVQVSLILPKQTYMYYKIWWYHKTLNSAKNL